MTQPEAQQQRRIIYERLKDLILDYIKDREMDIFLDVLANILAENGNYYFKLNHKDVVLLYTRDMQFDNGLELYILTKHGLEIRIDFFKQDKYVKDIQISYSLVNSVP